MTDNKKQTEKQLTRNALIYLLEDPSRIMEYMNTEWNELCNGNPTMFMLTLFEQGHVVCNHKFNTTGGDFSRDIELLKQNKKVSVKLSCGTRYFDDVTLPNIEFDSE